jgi:uncharacterized protein YegJ (DUF2314 family)
MMAPVAALLLLPGAVLAEAGPGLGPPRRALAGEVAVLEARNRLPEFVAALKSREGERFALKARFKTWDGGSEQLWLDQVELAEDGFTGVAANRPRNVPGIRAGQRVLVEEEQVLDWMFRRGGRLVGAFTPRALDTWLEETQR